jgi:hypothetical protein
MGQKSAQLSDKSEPAPSQYGDSPLETGVAADVRASERLVRYLTLLCFMARCSRNEGPKPLYRCATNLMYNYVETYLI